MSARQNTYTPEEGLAADNGNRRNRGEVV